MTDKLKVTLQDIAQKYGINKPALYARLKKLESENPELTLHYKKGNTLYLTETGIELLEEGLNENPTNRTRKEQESEILQNYINMLEKQLEVKDRTIDKLLSVLGESHILTSQQQQLQAIDVYQKKEKGRKSLIAKLVVAGKLLKGDYD